MPKYIKDVAISSNASDKEDANEEKSEGENHR